MTPLPRSFREVAGWREAFMEAAEKLDNVRTDSLFPSLPHSLLGREVRAFTLADWTLLHAAKNPYVAGGEPTAAHAVSVLWILSAPQHRLDSRLNRFRRSLLTWRVMKRCAFDEARIVQAVSDFIDDAFIDMPGRFSASAKRGTNPVHWPRKSHEVELCAEVMAQFPAFTREALRWMPLAQFWQWLHAARALRVPDYRNYQLTDSVNSQAVLELNRMRAQAAASVSEN
jgi:hypothetical protein